MNGSLYPQPQGTLMDPRTAMLTQMGLGLMAGSGPSRTPTSFGQSLGQAGMQGMQAYQQANQANQQNQMFQMKLAEAQREAAERKKREAAIAALMQDPKFAGMQHLLQVAPTQAIERAYPKDNKPMVVAPGSSLVDPEKPQQPLYTAPRAPQGAASDLGKLAEDLKAGLITQADHDEKRKKLLAPPAPVAQVDVKVPIRLGESLAGKVGDIATEGRASASGAVDIVNTVGRVRTALTSGNVNLGPGSTVLNRIDQVAQVMGVGGKDTEERLVNTRNTIRGLAQFTVGARKSLKGQGQVSDYEGRLLTKAESGEISDFTIPELKDFLKVTERLARKSHAEHKRIIGVMSNSKDDAIKGLVPYFDIPDLAPETPDDAPKNFPTPSVSAINRLKMSPSERSQFEAVFGPGSAEKYLGR